MDVFGITPFLRAGREVLHAFEVVEAENVRIVLRR